MRITTGDELKLWRTSQGLTQKELAKLLGVSKGKIQTAEKRDFLQKNLILEIMDFTEKKSEK